MSEAEGGFKAALNPPEASPDFPVRTKRVRGLPSASLYVEVVSTRCFNLKKVT